MNTCRAESWKASALLLIQRGEVELVRVNMESAAPDDDFIFPPPPTPVRSPVRRHHLSRPGGSVVHHPSPAAAVAVCGLPDDLLLKCRGEAQRSPVALKPAVQGGGWTPSDIDVDAHVLVSTFWSGL